MGSEFRRISVELGLHKSNRITGLTRGDFQADVDPIVKCISWPSSMFCVYRPQHEKDDVCRQISLPTDDGSGILAEAGSFRGLYVKSGRKSL